MTTEGLFLEESEDDKGALDDLIGESAAWRKVMQQIALVAPSKATVLLTGESGTGKEVVAKAIHLESSRRDRPIVKVNCAAIAPELFESEFFGHARGAFTGAHKERAGRFGLADGGTIFLDEVGEIPQSLQGKLLRVLQEGQYERLGEDRTRSVDVRVIAATNRDLSSEVEAGRFRQDLFYRLSVFPIHIASLRERLEDVPLLAKHFLRKMNWRDRANQPMQLSEENVRALQSYHYPGNVRELENIIERASILTHCFLHELDVQQILDAMLLSEQRKQLSSVSGGRAAGTRSPRIMTYAEMKSSESENVIAALQSTNYRIYGSGGAAELLGVKPTTLASRIKALRIPLRPTS
ncbi:MAG TPA: sigma 54-interacting transcriptional regulator [Pyrinomonadaceae bacterium]|jgi:transcriptional regulator with GAF, ATPase, and Fis domain|nr:sigma 54-interacting transcriptional regulator [Pyrinomonadaceae bacterium]